jgi:hypothetical protein
MTFAEQEDIAVEIIGKLSEYAISKILFDHNTSAIRSDFINYTNDIIKDRNIGEWYVKCDETNNTAEQINNSEFHAEVGITYIGRAILIDVGSPNGINIHFGPLSN